METAWEIYRRGGPEALWNRCCGFLDLTLQETMAVQHNLLEEQLDLLNRGPLGALLFRGAAPKNAEHLRRSVPLTTYDDYAGILGGQRRDALPEPVRMWVRTSGRTGQPKWAPITERSMNELAWPGMGMWLLATADRRGDVRLRGEERFLDLLAPPPYLSGATSYMFTQIWPVRHLPPPTEDVHALPFEDRIALGFGLALEQGADLTVSIASVLAALGEAFSGRSGERRSAEVLKKPRIALRIGRAAMKALLTGRSIYPRDLWRIRGIIAGGTDTSLFRDRIRQAWGRYPLECFGSTEAIVIATQAWDYTGMTFVPTLNFFEFIPEDEVEREEQEAGYRPRTVLLDEVEAGRNYELVVTSFHGRPFVRYRTGDLIRITSMRNERAGINLPQMAYYSRRSDVIDIAGFTRVTEKVVWQAIEEAGVPYVDWTTRKEVWDSAPVLHLMLEPKPANPLTEDEAQERIHRALCRLDEDWANLEAMAGLRPLRVTYLPRDSFQRYMDRKRAEGAEPAHLKPVHMNATDGMIAALLDGGSVEDLVPG